MIDDHFGHCEFYTIVTVGDDNSVAGSTSMPSPQGCGCKSNIAARLSQDGVTVMLAGNMGQGALDKLSANGIEVIRGCHGPVDDVVADYLAGRLQDSGMGCNHHGDEGHQCHNH